MPGLGKTLQVTRPGIPLPGYGEESGIAMPGWARSSGISDVGPEVKGKYTARTLTTLTRKLSHLPPDTGAGQKAHDKGDVTIPLYW